MEEKISRIQKELKGLKFKLNIPERILVYEGPLDLLHKGRLKSFVLFLFNDILLYAKEVKSKGLSLQLQAKQKKQPTLKYVGHKHLKNCLFMDCEDEFKFHIYHTDDKTKVTFFAHSRAQKTEWKKNVEELTEDIAKDLVYYSVYFVSPTNEFKRSSLPMRRSLEDIPYPSSVSPSSISPSSSESCSPSPSPNAQPTSLLSSHSNPEHIPRCASAMIPSPPSSTPISNSNSTSFSSGISYFSSASSGSGSPSIFNREKARPRRNSSSFYICDEFGSNEFGSSGECDNTDTNCSSDEEDDPADDPDPSIVRVNGQIASGPMIVILKVVLSKQSDPSLMNAFLFKYNEFCTPKKLLQLLQNVYFKQDTDTQNSGTRRQGLSGSQKRVVTFLKIWIENLFDQDFEKSRLFGRVLKFVDQISTASLQDANEVKLSIIRANKKRLPECFRKCRESGEKSDPERKITSPASNGRIVTQVVDRVKFLEMDTSLIAEQITLQDHSCFQKINLIEFHQYSPVDDTLAPNIKKMIANFNLMSRWVETEIVGANNNKKRVEIVEKFILIAQKFEDLKNYNTLAAIIAGLNDHRVSRLKKVWKKLPISSQSDFDRMHELMSNQANYKNYREVLKRPTSPCCPFLAVYLRDIEFIEKGNDTKTTDGCGAELMNLQKLNMLKDLYDQVIQCQREKYTYTVNEVYQKFLNELPASVLPEGLLSKFSYAVERPARMIPSVQR